MEFCGKTNLFLSMQC